MRMISEESCHTEDWSSDAEYVAATKLLYCLD